MKLFNSFLKITRIVLSIKKLSLFFVAFTFAFYTAVSQEHKTTPNKTIQDYENILKNDTFITGKITDLETLPIVKASVFIKELDYTVKTDSNGLYKIDITNISESVKQLTLTYKASDFKSVSNTLETHKLTNMFNVVDVTLESTRVFKPRRKTVQKAPVHKQVIGKVKTFFGKLARR